MKIATMILAAGIFLISGYALAEDMNAEAPMDGVPMINAEVPAIESQSIENVKLEMNKEAAPAIIAGSVENETPAVDVVPAVEVKKNIFSGFAGHESKNEKKAGAKKTVDSQGSGYVRTNAVEISNSICPLTGEPLDLKDPSAYAKLDVNGYVFNVLPRAKLEYEKDPVQYADKIAHAISTLKVAH